MVGNPAALACAIGPATAAGLASLRRHRDGALLLLVGGAAIGVLAGDVSQLSRGEVERIWLPFVPWLAVAAAASTEACVARSSARRRPWVAGDALERVVSPMRILVTGGAGFIGSHVVDLLVAEGHDVVVLDSLAPDVHRMRPDYLNPHAELVVADVHEPSAWDVAKGVDAVCHQAARRRTGTDFGDVRRYVADNTRAPRSDCGRCTARGSPDASCWRPPWSCTGKGRYVCVEHGDVRAGPRTRTTWMLAASNPRVRSAARHCVVHRLMRTRRSTRATCMPRRSCIKNISPRCSDVSTAFRCPPCAITTSMDPACRLTLLMPVCHPSSGARWRTAMRPRCSRMAVRPATSCTSETWLAPTSSR